MSFTIHSLVRPLVPFVNKLFLQKAEGLDNIPKSGPYILACNHVSVPDEWLLANLVLRRDRRKLWFIARDDYWFTKAWGRFVSKLMCVLLIDWRVPSAVLTHALELLKAGEPVMIFPEGTRNFDRESLVLGKTGMIRLSLAARCPIIPAGYEGPNITTTWEGLGHLFKHTQAIIRFGAPLDFSAYYKQTITRELLYKLTDKVMVEIGKLCNKKPRLHT